MMSWGIGKTFVAVNDNEKICDYFTLSTARISYIEIPDEYKVRLPKYPIPAIIITRLAVRKDMKGKHERLIGYPVKRLSFQSYFLKLNTGAY